MPRVASNQIEIEYDTFGNSADPPLILIMGLGWQLIRWPEELCEALAGKGLYVIRFDNRDIGLSTKLDEAGIPNFKKILESFVQNNKLDVPYLLSDMASDTVGLMDALNISTAHLIGLSMGGMIAQSIAFTYPRRVRGLVSIMSSTGRPGLPPGNKEVIEHIMRPSPMDRDGAISHMIETDRLLTGPVFPFEEEHARDMATRSYDRCHYPQGSVRQMAAIWASGSRVEALASVRAPTLVIHGTLDPLIHVDAGRDTVKCIPEAKLLEIPGMGHYLSRDVWPTIIKAFTEHIFEVERA